MHQPIRKAGGADVPGIDMNRAVVSESLQKAGKYLRGDAIFAGTFEPLDLVSEGAIGGGSRLEGPGKLDQRKKKFWKSCHSVAVSLANSAMLAAT